MRRAALVAGLICIGCSDPTADPVVPPEEPIGVGPAVVLLHRSGLEGDTITATSSITIQVLDSAGYASKNTPVVFSVLPDSANDPSALRIARPQDSLFVNTSLTANTDASGKATLRVMNGIKPGTARVRIVSVPTQMALFVSYGTRVGALDRFVVTPATAMVVPGQTTTFTARATDRLGNVRSDTAVFTITDRATTTPDGTVTGVRTGIQQIEAARTTGAHTARGSATLFIVPDQTLAWVTTNISLQRVVIGGLSGPNVVPIDTSARFQQAPAWKPGSDRIVYGVSPQLRVHDAAGDRALPLGSLSAMTWPEYSPDGQWLYFSGVDQGVSRVYRMHDDGTDLQLMSGTDTATAPTVSPDGRQIAYASGPAIKVRDLATNTSRILTTTTVNTGSDAQSPRWSPNGKLIAYNGGGASFIADAVTGVSIRVGGPTLSAGPGYSWSADSEWLLTTGQAIYAPTQQFIAVSWLGRYPAFKR